MSDTRAEVKQIYAAINEWLGHLDPKKVQAEFRRQYGDQSTPLELTSFSIAEYGNDRMKRLWKRLYELGW